MTNEILSEAEQRLKHEQTCRDLRSGETSCRISQSMNNMLRNGERVSSCGNYIINSSGNWLSPYRR